MRQEYKPGETIRLVDGRTARIVRVFAALGLYDVKLHDGDHDRIDVRPEDIVCRVRRAAIWVDEPDEPAKQR